MQLKTGDETEHSTEYQGHTEVDLEIQAKNWASFSSTVKPQVGKPVMILYGQRFEVTSPNPKWQKWEWRKRNLRAFMKKKGNNMAFASHLAIIQEETRRKDNTLSRTVHRSSTFGE